MSVKVDKAQAGIFFCRRAHRAERNEMFASQQHRRFAVGEYLRGGGLYRLYRRGGVAEGQIEVSRVKYACKDMASGSHTRWICRPSPW